MATHQAADPAHKYFFPATVNDITAPLTFSPLSPYNMRMARHRGGVPIPGLTAPGGQSPTQGQVSGP